MRETLSVTGSIDSIDAGHVEPIGDTGRYLVEDRNVLGQTTGDIEGDFLMTYDANVAIATQSGPLCGTIDFHDEDEDVTYTAHFRARSEGELTSFTPGEGGTMELEIEGHLRFVDEARGCADLDAWLEVALDAEGHIVSILDSEMTISGFWMPDEFWV